VALCSIALLLQRHVSNPLLGVVAFLTILIATSLHFLLNGNGAERYFQYFPIRFIWPTTGLLLFSIYLAKPSKFMLFMLGIIAGISVFWNLDTGIPLVAAIGAALFGRAVMTKQQRPQLFLATLVFGIISTLTLVTCFVALQVKAQTPIDLAAAITYQRIFYGSGFGMLPLPLPLHPWQSVLGVYLAGLIVALSGWSKSPEVKLHDVLFCASILGLGLFTYYQGRSHVQNLVMVLWPAILIMVILADQTLQAVAKRAAPPTIIVVALPFVLFVALGTMTLLTSLPTIAAANRQVIATFYKVQDPLVAEELFFMRETRKERHCAILSQRQGIYHAELGYASPLPGPGHIETILQSDLDALTAEALRPSVECIYLGIAPDSETYIDLNNDKIITRFPVWTKNTSGSMLLLEPARIK
jgi:hypothetical protein